MHLRDLEIEDEASATRAQELLTLEGFPFLFDFNRGDDFAAYV